MGKLITLPLGMVIGDVSPIGQYSLILDKDYDATNIKIYEVRDVIQEGTYDLKLLSVSTYINKWAAFKPWKSTNTLAENHGMIISADEITYERPTDFTGYHLGHFAGYNHNVPSPTAVAGDTDIFYTVALPYSTTIGCHLTLPEFDIRTVGDNQIVNLYARMYQRTTLQSTTTVAITDTHITNQYIQVDVPLTVPADDPAFPWTIKFYLGATALSTTINFPSDDGGEVTITGSVADGNPTADFTLDNLTTNGTFTQGDSEIYNTAASVDLSSNYSVSFGQSSPAKGIWEPVSTSTEWGGYFNVYAVCNGVTEYITINEYKDETQYLWSESGVFTTIVVEPGDTVGFILEKNI